MTPEELRMRRERVARENLIVSETEEGFRVYSPNAPHRVWIVSDDPDAPTCTCPDFQHHAHDPEWRCKHILAVFDRNEGSPETSTASRASWEPDRAFGGEDLNAELSLKRSVSPDGRIDSLSVEISCPVNGAPASELGEQASRIIALQEEIVSRFLNREEGAAEADEADSATILGIGGSDGRYGRRLFLTFRANGRNLRLYGSRKQLAQAIAAAGQRKPIEAIREGARLNLPCRIVTQPTEDGRYFNIEKVLPPRRQRVGQ